MYWEILFNLGEMGRLFTLGAIFVIYFSMPVYDLQIQRFVSYITMEYFTKIFRHSDKRYNLYQVNFLFKIADGEMLSKVSTVHL